MIQATRPHGGATGPEERGPRAVLAADRHRPQYHFLPPANWMNDPNGVIQWQGQYHLFYQYNPHGVDKGIKHWGHAVSPDLVHWTHLPVALAPSPGSPDQDGCWSGCMVVNAGVPTAIYTGARGGAQLPCLATSDDGLRSFRKDPGNPVIASPPPGLDVVGFRDHSIWQEGDTWYMVIGSGIRGVGGAVLLYRSADLRTWEYLHPLYQGDRNRKQPFATGAMWECPDFVPLGGKHVLILSVWDDAHHYRLGHAVYFVGRYEDHRFVPETEGIIDVGGHFYAPQSMRDDQGRRLMWGWLWEGRDDETVKEAGWAGIMSLPRVVSLLPDGSLTTEPAPELHHLRGEHHRLTNVEIGPGTEARLDGVAGDCLEIAAEFVPGDAAAFGLRVRCSPDRAEATTIVYDHRAGTLTLDCERSSLDVEVDRPAHAAALPLAPGEPLRLHIFLDRSVIEVFANRRVSMTDRVYPSRSDSLGVELFAIGGRATLGSLDVWEMGSIWAAEGDGPMSQREGAASVLKQS